MTTADARTAFSLADSVPGDYSLPHPGRRRAQRGADRPRRPRLRAARLLRVRHRHAHDRRPRRRRPPVQPLPRHQPLLADARVPDDRPQPPRRRHGLPHRPADGVPRLHGPHPAVGDAAAARAARRGLQHARHRQVAPRARWRAVGRGSVRPLAARVRLRALLRLPAGRHQPLGAEPRPRQPLRRAAPRAAGRLPPHRGPRRRGDPVDHRAAPGRARQSVLPLLRARRDARAAPRRARVGRAVPGRVRPRLGAVARRRVRASARDRRRARRHRAQRAAELDRRVVVAVGRRAAHARAPAGGVRRLPVAHRRADRPRRRPARRARRARQHDRSCSSPTTAPAARAARSARSTSTASPSTCPTPSRATSRGATSSAGCAPTRTTRGAGRGPATRRCGCGSATRGSAAPARRSSCTGPRASTAAATVRDQFVHAVDLMPTVLDAARHRRRPTRSTASSSSRSTARRSAPRSPTATRRRRAPTQYFEMLGSRSIVADGWKATTDHVSKGVVDEERLVEGSREFADDEWALFRLRRRLLRDARRRRRASRRARRPAGAVAVGGRAQPGLPARRRAHRPHRRGGAVAERGPRAAVYRPEGGPVPDDSVARLFGGFRLVASRRRARGRRRGRPRRDGRLDRRAGAVRARRPARVRAQPRRRRGARRERRADPGGRARAHRGVHAGFRRARASACSTTTSSSPTRCSRCPRRWCSSTAAPCSCSGATAGSPCATTTSRRSRGPARCTRSSSRPGPRSSRR